MNEGIKKALEIIKAEAEKKNWRKVNAMVASFNSFQERVYRENGYYIDQLSDDNPGYREAGLLDWEGNFYGDVYSVEM